MTCKEFLITCLPNQQGNYDKDLEIKLSVYIDQCFGNSELSVETKTDICLKYFGHTPNELVKMTNSLEGMQTGDILSPHRFPYVFSMNEYERELYFSIIDAYCTHREKCDCCLIMPHRFKDEE